MWQSVEYSSFSVGPETDKYRLNVAGFSGDAGDALANPVNPAKNCNGMKFTTRDQDNDGKAGHCINGGTYGWWFNACADAFLNRDDNTKWDIDNNDYKERDVQFARMLVKFD